MTTTLPRGIGQRGDSFTADVTYRGRRRTGTAPTMEDAIFLRHHLMSELTGTTVTSTPARLQVTWTLGKAINITEQVAWRGSAWGVDVLHTARQFAKFVRKGRTLDTIDTVTLDQWVADLGAEGKSDAAIHRICHMIY